MSAADGDRRDRGQASHARVGRRRSASDRPTGSRAGRCCSVRTISASSSASRLPRNEHVHALGRRAPAAGRAAARDRLGCSPVHDAGGERPCAGPQTVTAPSPDRCRAPARPRTRPPSRDEVRHRDAGDERAAPWAARCAARSGANRASSVLGVVEAHRADERVGPQRRGRGERRPFGPGGGARGTAGRRPLRLSYEQRARRPRTAAPRSGGAAATGTGPAAPGAAPPGVSSSRRSRSASRTSAEVAACSR